MPASRLKILFWRKGNSGSDQSLYACVRVWCVYVVCVCDGVCDGVCVCVTVCVCVCVCVCIAVWRCVCVCVVCVCVWRCVCVCVCVCALQIDVFYRQSEETISDDFTLLDVTFIYSWNRVRVCRIVFSPMGAIGQLTVLGAFQRSSAVWVLVCTVTPHSQSCMSGACGGPCCVIYSQQQLTPLFS